MEQQIRDIISNLEGFELADFINEKEERPDSDAYFVQIRVQESNIWTSENNFDIRADIFLTYDDKNIDVYSRKTDNIPENDIMRLINALRDNLSGVGVTKTLLRK